MTQDSLFHEDVWQALTDCVRALGGAKKVGSAMRPELTVEAASRWLLDCLNPARNDKLCVEQVMWLLREARDVGCHAGMAYINRDAGYADPVPVDAADAASDLERKFVSAVETLADMTQRIADLRARAQTATRKR